MHSAGLELTKLTYTRLEDNLIRHRGDRYTLYNSYGGIQKLRFVRFHCIVSALHCSTLHCSTLHCPTLHCSILHCSALHCSTLHCSTLHCSTLLMHCSTPSIIVLLIIHCSTRAKRYLEQRHYLCFEALNLLRRGLYVSPAEPKTFFFISVKSGSATPDNHTQKPA